MFSGENVGVFGGTNIAVSSGGTANINGSSGTYSRALEILMSKVSSRALHNSGEISDPPKCHPGTRIEVLDVLLTWATAATYLFPIKWLTGPAGAGKSAIMRTFAEMLVQHGLLLASFFFFRSDGNRNTASQLITTLVYQICRAIPHIRPYIEEAIDLDPLIFTSTLRDQIQILIVDPFLRFFYHPNSITINPFPRIILIDGLDECQEEDTQREILDVFCETVRTLPIPVAIVIASRPEYQIRSAFDLGHVNRTSSRIVLDDSFEPDEDIKTFYHAEFNKIRRTHPMRSYLPAIWPTAEVIVALVRNASGQFIYASTVIKFVRSIRHKPSARLDMILGLLDRGTLKPFQQLDLVYATILLNIQEEDLPAVLRVLGIILTPPPARKWSEHKLQSPSLLERLLGYHEGEVQRLLIDLESLLAMPSDSHTNIRIFHTSLGDFLFDKSRAEGLSIDKAEVYADIAGLCIGHFFTEFHELLFLYISHQIPGSLQKALPTDRLRQNIVACNMEKLSNLVFRLDSNPYWPPNYGLKILAPMFLDALQISTFSDGKALHMNKVMSLRKSLIPKMTVYLDNEYLFGLLIISLTTEYEAVRGPQFLEALGLVPTTELIRWDRQEGLDLGQFSPGPNFLDPFIQLVLDFLACPSDLLDSSKVQTQCTDLAVRFLFSINQNGGRCYQDCCESERAMGNCSARKLLPYLFKHALVRGDLTNIARVVLSSRSEYMKISGTEEALASYMQLAIQRDPETQMMTLPELGPQEDAVPGEIGIKDMIPRSVLYRELSREDPDSSSSFYQQNDPLLMRPPPAQFPPRARSSQHIDRLLSKCQRRE